MLIERMQRSILVAMLIRCVQLDADDHELQEVGREVIEVILAVLAAYKLRGDEALHAVRGLRSIVHGFVSLEAAGGFGLPLDLDESFRRLVQMFIRGLE